MKTGIELIAAERKEHVEKHGFDSEHDKNNKYGEMAQAAAYLLSLDFYTWSRDSGWVNYPESWAPEWKDKFKEKTKIEGLIIAGSLIAAEIDRLQLVDGGNVEMVSKPFYITCSEEEATVLKREAMEAVMSEQTQNTESTPECRSDYERLYMPEASDHYRVLKKIADDWLAKTGKVFNDGLIIFFNGELKRWTNWTSPSDYQPGSIAIDECGVMYAATGSNGYDGAVFWMPLA